MGKLLKIISLEKKSMKFEKSAQGKNTSEKCQEVSRKQSLKLKMLN